MKGIPKLVQYIDSLCMDPVIGKLVTARFRNLNAEKKVQVVEAVCKEAVLRSDPSDLNIKDAAKAGSIAVGTLYTYFSNRENVLLFTILVIKEFIIRGMQLSEKYLKMLPFPAALYYYCIGGLLWSEEEKPLAGFFFKAAYSGNRMLSNLLVKPAAVCFRQVLYNLLEKAFRRRKLKKSLDYYTGLLYTALIPLADSLIYPELSPYFTPGGISKRKLKERISSLISCIR